MRRLAQIALLVVVALHLSCSDKGVVRETEPLYTPRYAKGFSIVRDKASGEKLLCVTNPWQGANEVTLYTVIDTLAPAKRIVAMSSSHAAMLDAIGCADRIVGLSGCKYIYNATLCKAIAEGKIGEVGYDSAFDFEKIRSLNPDIILIYGVAGETKSMTSKLDELSIPYIYIGDYLEADPLGKAEWVVALATLCGEEERGAEFFAEVEERYNTVREECKSLTHKPRVMLNTPYRDTWFMPPHNSYMVRLIEDAGGEYVLTENGKRKTENVTYALSKSRDCETQNEEQKTKSAKRKTENGTYALSKSRDCETQNEEQKTKSAKLRAENTSHPISLEEALVLAMRADFWLNLGQIATIEELKASVPRFAAVEAVQRGRLYNNTKRTNENRGSDFWESGAIRPDLILEDLVKILHHEAPTDSLHYYKRLQ